MRPDSASLGRAVAAGTVASFGLAYLCIRANQLAAEQGGCPAPAIATGFPAPPGAERKDCCPRWLIVAMIALGVGLAIWGLAKL